MGPQPSAYKSSMLSENTSLVIASSQLKESRSKVERRKRGAYKELLVLFRMMPNHHNAEMHNVE
jgi:hypothetical protein